MSHTKHRPENSGDSSSETDETDRIVSRHRADLGESSNPCRCEPPANASKTTRPKWLPPGYNVDKFKIAAGNPVYGFRVQMFCRTGFHLAIFEDKRVRGVDQDKHPCALLEFSSVDLGEVRIRGLETNLYLAMDEDGRLYGEANHSSPATVFVEYTLGQYNTYLSRHWAHLGYYVAIKKTGRTKPAYLTRWGQKAMQFLLRRIRT